MLPGVDFDFQTEPNHRRKLGFKTVGERGTTWSDVALGFAKPRIQLLPKQVEGIADGFLAKLDEIEIFGVTGGGLEDNFVEGGATAEEQALSQDRVGVDFHQAAGKNEVLFHLGRRDPRALLRPLGNVGGCDHRSVSGWAFSRILQRFPVIGPVRGAPGSRAARDKGLEDGSAACKASAREV